MISRQTFSWLDHPDVSTIPVDLEYDSCNFAREAPIDIGGGVMRGTRLFPGDDTPRTFTDCNLLNCEPPPGSILVDCNTHMSSPPVELVKDTVTLPNASVKSIKSRSTLHHGRYDPKTESYIDNPAPVEYPA